MSLLFKLRTTFLCYLYHAFGNKRACKTSASKDDTCCTSSSYVIFCRCSRSSIMRSLAAMMSLSVAANAIMTTAPWPSLNASLAGRLQVTTPLALPCFSSYNGQPHAIDLSSCILIRDNYTSNTLRTTRVEAYMHIQNEMCLSDPADECVLDDTVLPAPMPSENRTCRQGSVPSYHIVIDSASDVTTAFDFARTYGVELSVKNAGHDYMTRGAGRGTLTIYTHNLTDMTFDPLLVPEGCNTTGQAAVTLAPGVDTSTAIAFANANNSTILTAYSPTVPVSTGWVLGAGHSVLSPVYGLGADRVLSYDIVTPMESSARPARARTPSSSGRCAAEAAGLLEWCSQRHTKSSPRCRSRWRTSSCLAMPPQTRRGSGSS